MIANPVALRLKRTYLKDPASLPIFTPNVNNSPICLKKRLRSTLSAVCDLVSTYKTAPGLYSHNMNEDTKINDFQTVIRQILEIYENTEELQVSGEDAVRMAKLHGLLAHTFGMTRAALVLIDNRQIAASNVLARVALEHAVFAQWAHLHWNGLVGLSQAEVITYRKLFNGLKTRFRFSQSIKDFYAATMKKPKDVHLEVKKFYEMCNSFVDGDELYNFYRLLSGYVHPGNLTKRLYHDIPAEGQPIMLRWHAHDQGLLPTLHNLTLSVALAAWIYEDLRDGKPRLVELQSIAAQVDISVPLVLKSATHRSGEN